MLMDDDGDDDDDGGGDDDSADDKNEDDKDDGDNNDDGDDDHDNDGDDNSDPHDIWCSPSEACICISLVLTRGHVFSGVLPCLLPKTCRSSSCFCRRFRARTKSR